MSVAIVTIARKEHEYIKEFIEIHRKIGISKFYIYDNGLPEDLSLSILLKDYTDCRIIPFQGQIMQFHAYKHFVSKLLQYSDEEWFAFIDIDEFIVPIKHKTIQEFLKEYGHLKSIGINWKMFSTSGHVKKPEGWITKNYIHSCFNPHIKTLIHKSVLTPNILCVHNINKSCKRLTGENINGPFNPVDLTNIICINHYFCKSWSEFIQKCNRGRADISLKRNVSDYINDLTSINKVVDLNLLEIINEKPNELSLKYDIHKEIKELETVLDKTIYDKVNTHYHLSI